MYASRFDHIARRFAERRQARRQAGQEEAGTPPASGIPGFPVQEKIHYLFVQSFQGGSLTPTGDPDRHTLTLEGGLGHTVYFADRPSRDVGVSPTPRFLETLGFSDDNPPNAALLVDAGDGETDIAVVELFDPVYDEATHTATYQVKGLQAWEDSLSLGLQDAPADLSSLAGTLGASHLFIDDCPNDRIECRMRVYGYQEKTVGTFDNQGFCYNFGLCIPCEPYGHDHPDRGSVVDYWSQRCNDTYTECNGTCVGHFTNRCPLTGVC